MEKSFEISEKGKFGITKDPVYEKTKKVEDYQESDYIEEDEMTEITKGHFVRKYNLTADAV